MIHCTHKLEAHEQTLVGKLTIITDNAIIFDIPCAIDFLLDKFGLLKLVHQGGQEVQLAVTIDGKQLAWKVYQISWGVKFTDLRMEDPVDDSSTPLFGAEGIDKLQSHNVCHPLHVVTAKDNGETLEEHFKPSFDIVNQLEDCYNTATTENSKPNFLVVHPADMAALHKTVGHWGNGQC